MAKLPPLRRLILGDYATQAGWISPLLQNINNFNESVFNAFNQTLTVNDNTTGAIASITLTAAPTATNPAQIQWTKTSTPAVVLIGGITQHTVNKSNSITKSGTVLSAGTGLEWQYVTSKQGNYIRLTNVPGIPAPTTNVTITLQLLIFAG